jgi:hypothetical protein
MHRQNRSSGSVPAFINKAQPVNQPNNGPHQAPVASSSSVATIAQQGPQRKGTPTDTSDVATKTVHPPSVFANIESDSSRNLQRWSAEYAKSKGFLGKTKAIFNGGKNLPAAVRFEQDDQLGRNLSLAIFGEHFKRHREQPDPVRLARAVALIEEVRDFHKDGVTEQHRERVFPDIQSRKQLHSLAIDSYLSSMHEDIPREILEASASNQYSGLHHRGIGITATVIKPGVSAAGVAGGTTGLVTALAVNLGLTAGGAVANLGLAASMRRFTKGKESLAPHLVPVPSPFSKNAPDVKTSAILAKDYGEQSRHAATRLSAAIEDVKKLKDGEKGEDYDAAVAALKDTLADAEITIETQNKIKTGMQNAATEFNGNRENIITGVAVSVGLTAGAGVVAGTHGVAAPAAHLIADAVSGGAAAAMYSAYHFFGGPQREGKKKFNDILINNLKSTDMLAADSPMSRTQVAKCYGEYLQAYKAELRQNQLSEDSTGAKKEEIEKRHMDALRDKLQGVFDYTKVNNFSIKPVTQRVDLAKKLLQGKLAQELEKALPYTKVGEPNTVPHEIKQATGQLISDLANIAQAEKCIKEAAEAIPISDVYPPNLTPEQNEQLRVALAKSAEMLAGLGDEQVKLLFTGKLRDQLGVQFASTDLMMLEAERYEWTVQGGGAIAEITKDALVVGDVGAAGFNAAHESLSADISGDVLNSTNKLIDNSVKPSAGEAGAIRNTLQKSDIVRDIREKSMSAEFKRITQTEMQVPLARASGGERTLNMPPPYSTEHFDIDALFDGRARLLGNSRDLQEPADFYIPKALDIPGAGKVSLADTKSYFTQAGKSPADKEPEADKKTREKELNALLRKAYWGPAVDTFASLPRRINIKNQMKKGRNARRKIEQSLLVEAKQLVQEYDEGQANAA